MNGVVLQSTINSLSLATVAMSIIMLMSLTAIVVMYRHFHKLVAQQDAIIGQLRNDLGQLHSGSEHVDNRLDKLEKKAKFLSRRQYL